MKWNKVNVIVYNNKVYFLPGIVLRVRMFSQLPYITPRQMEDYLFE
jgi:hypothetical protein